MSENEVNNCKYETLSQNEINAFFQEIEPSLNKELISNNKNSNIKIPIVNYKSNGNKYKTIIKNKFVKIC